MRLDRIKLAGFKSFVDPTTVIFPSNLSGVVGPNGCGKSNIIDAVRWVMGESSAKTLRGESITDVIFNGSVGRKPVGQASIELIFDNRDGKLGGEYAKFSEISIKRIVTRDAHSTYLLNNTRCRRKDIVGVFLGTGMGPRSYSIIEQGTISKLIEAKPDEMRAHLEEVSGISKYKERRRETENRIRHTRENLDRLKDLRDEIEKQIEKLKRQANAAERFKVLKEEEHLLRAQSQALRWKDLNEKRQGDESKLQELVVSLEAKHSEHQRIETDITNLRESKHDITERYNEVQSQYYSLGADVTRIEQAMSHYQERQDQLQGDFEQAQTDWSETKHHLELDVARKEEFTKELEENSPALEAAQEKSEETKAALEEAEEAMQLWQNEWDDFNKQAADVSQTAQVEQTRIQHIEQRQSSSKQRLEKLIEERSQLDLTSPEQECETIQENLLELEKAQDISREKIESSTIRTEELKTQHRVLTDELDDSKSELQTLRGRHASIEALQQDTLEQSDEKLNAWLTQHDLKNASRIAQVIDVEKGWENAVETVLGHFVKSLCVKDINAALNDLSSLEGGTVTLFDGNMNVVTAASKSFARLSEKVQGPTALMAMFETVYIAKDLTEAKHIREDLAAHESVVTQEGYWLGKAWAHVVRESNLQSGMIQRERDLKELTADIARIEQDVEAKQAEQENTTEQLDMLETEKAEQQEEFNQQQTSQSELAAQLSVMQAKIEQLKHRSERLEEDIEELRAHFSVATNELNEAKSTWQDAMTNMEKDADIRETLLAKRDECKQTLETSQQLAREERDATHRLEVQVQSLGSQLEMLEQSIERLSARDTQARARYEQLKEALSHDGDSPIEEMKANLEEALQKRVTVESELNEVKHQLDESEHALLELEERRHQVDKDTEQVRARLEQSRLKGQELKVRCQTLQEQLDESGQNLEEVLAQIPEELNEQIVVEQLDRTVNKINRLGPINLAAIDEFQVESERKEYLDKQNSDLEEALETLENAIAKIDAETRERFKETYDTVNKHFQEYFPKAFGGGSASLELTGEDLLNTGVSVMARPPGKKNSTIHLLSGGEKALTAIALVFSLFQINPAPFCMLDEVDAPLDDANVNRYCNLVKEMSDQVQFIFISHNKGAIEMAEQLTGVTMHEPGVSRIVSVDIKEAVALAEA